jgi:hypothetical protein
MPIEPAQPQREERRLEGRSSKRSSSARALRYGTTLLRTLLIGRGIAHNTQVEQYGTVLSPAWGKASLVFVRVFVVMTVPTMIMVVALVVVVMMSA